MTKKYRIMLSGKNKRSFFIIPTQKGKSLAIDADFEDQAFVLKEGTAVKVEDIIRNL